MKSYSEKKGKTAFDWNSFLQNPPEKGSEDHSNSSNLSGSWVTCACGNLCDIIPRSILGRPEDFLLEKLGFIFHEYVNAADFINAKNTLYLIEKRSEEIIFELTNPKDLSIAIDTLVNSENYSEKDIDNAYHQGWLIGSGINRDRL